MKDVVIVSAARTPIGAFNGSLSSVPSHVLGASVIKEALERAKVGPHEVSEVIMGQVLTGGQGMNPARQASVGAGIPYEVPASGISMVCGSGLRSVIVGTQSIQCGSAEIVVAGGQESMSQSIHGAHIRNGIKFGNFDLKDLMIADGLTDAFHNIHMGITAENVAKEFEISRQEQDEFTLNSQLKTKIAQENGFFEREIVAIQVQNKATRTDVLISRDEHPKPQTSLEGLGKLRPAFDKAGTVTAGNSSGLNDGAAAVILMSSDVAASRSLQPMAKIVAHAAAGVKPEVMGTGPIPAVQKALSIAGWSTSDVDLYELNEAFASQSIAVVRGLGLDPSKVNVSGGAIALGHPIGASGCRILVTLVHNLQRLNKRRGVAALCIGGGMGIAICVENVA